MLIEKFVRPLCTFFNHSTLKELASEFDYKVFNYTVRIIITILFCVDIYIFKMIFYQRET